MCCAHCSETGDLSSTSFVECYEWYHVKNGTKPVKCTFYEHGCKCSHLFPAEVSPLCQFFMVMRKTGDDTEKEV